MKTLYCNAHILLRENGAWKVLKNAFLGVENDRFCYIGQARPADVYTREKDLGGKLVVPGLYNCHTHSSMVLLRGVGSDLPLDQWLFGSVFPVEEKLTARHIAAGSGLALMEMIAGGTVSFSDMYFFPEETAKAVLESGMKANICRPVQDFSFAPREEAHKRIRESMELLRAYNGAGNGRLRIDFSIHAEYTCSEEITAEYAALCRENGGNMHIHLSETVKEHEECKAKYGKTPARWFCDLGAFDSRAFAAHCVALEDEDIEILKEHGVSVVHNPTSNLKLGSGVAPIPEFISRGLNVCLGTDGAASNNNLNIFEEMHLAALIHNGVRRDATVMPADTVLDLATVNGAKLQGRERCGEIREGYQADFIAIGLDRPHMIPQLDYPALLVYSAAASDVCLTVADGRELYENGEFLTLDREKIQYEVKNAVAALYA